MSTTAKNSDKEKKWIYIGWKKCEEDGKKGRNTRK
jgi:hypothetical protein